MHDLQTEFGKEMDFEVLSADAPENKKVINANNLGTHGALAKTASGRVIWTAPGHKMGREKLMQGVEAVRKSWPEKLQE